MDQTTAEQVVTDMSIYTDNGHANRVAYLKSLAVEYGVPYKNVILAASLLGPIEDFDGLVTTIQDHADYWRQEQAASQREQTPDSRSELPEGTHYFGD
jgi:hypothetical protein